MIEDKTFKINNKGKKICLLTDLHFDTEYDLSILDKILDNVSKNKPDFICLSGDIIDNSNVVLFDSINILTNFIKKLSDISSVIISLGNHEITLNKHKGNIDKVIDYFNSLKIENVYFLNNKSLVRDDLCFIGFNPDFEYYRKEESKYFIKEIDKLVNLNKRYYNILLCHSPINVFNPLTLKYSKQIKKSDLILSGHMHNGLILKCFDHKGTWGLISPLRKLFPKYTRNKAVKKIDDHTINLIISGGIVKFSNTTPKIVRKFNKLFPISIVYVEV